jgi:hypothetical protein
MKLRVVNKPKNKVNVARVTKIDRPIDEKHRAKTKRIPPKTSIYELPPHFDGATMTEYSLKFSDFEKENRGKTKKTKRDSQLIIGFDTEFKTPPQALTRAELKQGLGRYEVLSYQFHCIFNENVSWSGICCPERDKRISLGSFIVFALS